jgi:hypothetical protein
MHRSLALAGLLAVFVFSGCDKKTDDVHHSGKAQGAATNSVAQADLFLHPTPEQVAAATPVGNRICPVSGDSLGSMGAPVQVVYKGKLVGLCCSGCPGNFGKDPDALLAKAEASVPKP